MSTFIIPRRWICYLPSNRDSCMNKNPEIGGGYLEYLQGPIVTGSAKRRQREESQLVETWQQKQEAAALEKEASGRVPWGSSSVGHLPPMQLLRVRSCCELRSHSGPQLEEPTGPQWRCLCAAPETWYSQKKKKKTVGGRRGHKPRQVGSLWKLEKNKDTFSWGLP